jgi:hypothetical protein
LGFNQNTRRFDSAARDNLTNGEFSRVEPDAVDARLYADIEGVDFDIVLAQDASFWEVKAYTSNMYLSTSNYQIQGEIDALSALHLPGSLPGNLQPAFYLATLSGSEISQSVTDYAISRGVSLYHIVFDVTGRDVSLADFKVKHSTGFNSALPVITFDAAAAGLDCPDGGRGRLDEEVLN